MSIKKAPVKKYFTSLSGAKIEGFYFKG